MHMDYKWYSSDHLKWIGIVGIPSIIIWVIATPVFAFVILFKNRDKLEDEDIKKYYLILYQGLTDKVFYWEFVNTIRKVIIIGVNTVLSVLSIIYRLMLCIIILVAIERLQVKLKPYKLEENNRIEIKAIVGGTTILFWGLLFEEGSKHYYPWFNTMAILIILTYNSYFVLGWLYLLIWSFKIKNEKVELAVELLKCLLWKKKVTRFDINNDEINETSTNDKQSKYKSKEVFLSLIMLNFKISIQHCRYQIF